MRFLVFVFAVTILFTAGCAPSTNQAGVTSPTTARMEIVDGPLIVGSKHVYIIKDKQSEKEFIIVNGSECTAITTIP